MNKFKKLLTNFVSSMSLFAVVFAAQPLAFGKRDGGKLVVVADGLHSPRGLAFGPGNILYAAQAGDAAQSGSIIEIRNSMSAHPSYRTIVSGLPVSGEEGEFIGVDGISVLGRGTKTSIYAIMGESPQGTGDNAFGNLLKIGLDGTINPIANVGFFDYEWTIANPDPKEPLPDANPYGILAVPGHTYLVDAGSNTLDEVTADGSIRILAFFPDEIIRDAVPTCVAQGPDGALYIGTLALVDTFVFGPSAKVYRVEPAQANLNDPANTPMTLWASGLSPVNGCTFDSNGNFYASQLFTNNFADPRGDVVKIPFSSPTTHTSLTDGALSFAGGVAVAPNGDVFVADGTFGVPNGRIVRIRH